MTKWTLVVDLDKCTGCHACVLACKDEFWGNDYTPYSAAQPKFGHFWMRIIERERGRYPGVVKVTYLPVPCMHCDDPLCVKEATDGAVYKRPDGIVIIDPKKAVGQKQLVEACPYCSIFWNEEKNLPQMCTFCVHLIDKGWRVPRCVEACPTDALMFDDADDPDSEVSKIIASGRAELLHSEYGTRPRVYYLGLPQYTKYFMVGTMVFEDTDECAERVSMTITNSFTGKSTATKTNNFGDFIFDALELGKYIVKIEHPGYSVNMINVDLRADTYLGDIMLTKAKTY